MTLSGTWIRAAAAGLAIAVLGGCTYFELAEANKPITVGDKLTVQAPVAWNRHKNGKIEQWTVDGPGLQQLVLLSGIKDGEGWDQPPVIRIVANMMATDVPRAENRPIFKKTMTPLEIADLLQANFQRTGAAQFKMDGLQPASFVGAKGFRMDFSFFTKDGLAKKGLAVGAVQGDQLYMGIYTGAQLYYFPRHKADAETVIESARLN